MKIRIKGHQIIDADITKVSLVKRGANRVPFQIIKHEGEEVRHADNFEYVQSEAARRGMKAVQMPRYVGGTPVQAIALFKAESFKGWALANGDIDTRDLMSTKLKKGNCEPPATPHEESADTAEKEARRAHVANRRVWESEQFALRREALFIADKQAPLSPRERARLLDIETRIAVLDSLIWDGPWDDVVTKQESSLDLLERGIATNFYRRGGTSQTIDANLPSEISKGADAQLADDLRADALGIHRRPANVQKSDDDELVSNSIGLRSQRRQQ